MKSILTQTLTLIAIFNFSAALATEISPSNKFGDWELVKKIDEFSDEAQCRIESTTHAQNGKLMVLFLSTYNDTWGIFTEGLVDRSNVRNIGSIQIRIDSKPAAKLFIDQIMKEVVMGNLKSSFVGELKSGNKILARVPILGDAPLIGEFDLIGFTAAYEAMEACS